MIQFDPRVTPARPDLAAAYLKGKVEAAAFAEGRNFALTRGRCGLRARPDSHAALETELLHGETFTVYEEKDNWAWGQSALDKYVGYVHRISLGTPIAATHRVVALAAPALAAPDVKAAVTDLLPMNAKLRVEKQSGGFAETPAGFVALRHLAPIDAAQKDFVAVAERFLGAPYVWGGKTHVGIDCSGLIQTALEAAGILSPRDTDMMQDALGEARPVESPRARGDLIFWKGHVGVMLDDTRLLHANAFHMAVAVEPLADAIARIAPVISVRRVG